MKEATHNSLTRPPVVAVMGHVDHGKSALLDYIRKTNVVAGEAGGITQHVSAYEVEHVKDGVAHKITFLDTPGHEAFSQIRSRGAHIADVAILVISAEEGAKPQTLEAFKHITDRKLPVIVAINKIDRPNANPERVRQGLAEHGIYVEQYGGDIPVVATSAKTGEGIKELLDMILLVSEMQELVTDPKALADGFVLESERDPKKGLTATLIIKNGTLKKGLFVVAGTAMAPVRLLENFLGSPIESASAGSPVRLIGWNELPVVGNKFITVTDKKTAEEKVRQAPTKKTAVKHFADLKEEGVVIIPVVLKTDNAGSMEAIQEKLMAAATEKVKVRILESGIGNVGEQDIKTAGISPDTVIVMFNTKIDKAAAQHAERLNLSVFSFEIIYKLTEWFEELVRERTPKVEIEEVVGRLKITHTFSASKDRQVVGGKVQEGTVSSGEKVNVIRREHPIGNGTIRELQKQKKRADAVEAGFECGAMIESKIELAPGDIIEAFTIVRQ